MFLLNEIEYLIKFLILNISYSNHSYIYFDYDTHYIM